MSKETSSKEATRCACGGTFAFMEQHWPHCPMNPANLGRSTHGQGVHLLKLVQLWLKVELATIAQHGPVRDEKIGRRGKGPK